MESARPREQLPRDRIRRGAIAELLAVALPLIGLVSLLLRAEGFEHYRCDRNISLGVQTASLAKILKCSGNDDALSLSAEDNGDALNIMFEATCT